MALNGSIQMKKFRLKDNHELSQRVSDLMVKADELDISIDYSLCNNSTFLIDRKTGKEYLLEDVEDNKPVTCFPASTEYKITYNT